MVFLLSTEVRCKLLEMVTLCKAFTPIVRLLYINELRVIPCSSRNILVKEGIGLRR